MHESSIISNSNDDQLAARRELFDLMQTYPATQEELERSLGLFVRGSLLARMLATFEVYEQIVPLPGSILPHRIHKAKSYPSLCYLSFPEGGGVRT